MPDSQSNKVVGAKQTKRALLEGRASEVYLATDAEPSVTTPIRTLCDQQGLSPIPVATMAELGEMFQVPVGAAVAALLKA